jgi:hypothetical protein
VKSVYPDLDEFDCTWFVVKRAAIARSARDLESGIAPTSSLYFSSSEIEIEERKF